jgi:Fic family protein
MQNYKIKKLPPKQILETTKVLKKLAEAHRYLAELKGISATIPNDSILINTLSMQEAKDSSEIESIITTHDELFKTDIFFDPVKSPAAKEVKNYVQALKKGFALIKSKKILTNNDILEIHQEVKQNNAGFRKLAGTELKNQHTNQIVYTPPQKHEDILELMKNLESYINDDSLSEVDSLIKMAVVHFQFESIHPFYDGNGRMGRIINVIYLVIKDLLDLPILYLSRYITSNKANYYRLLQQVRDKDLWEPWIIYNLDAIISISKQMIWIINNIKRLMMEYKHAIRSEHPKIYSQDLLNNIFCHPYTKIGFVQDELKVSRITATKYLDTLSKGGFLIENKIGKHKYYINPALVELLSNIPLELNSQTQY